MATSNEFINKKKKYPKKGQSFADFTNEYLEKYSEEDIAPVKKEKQEKSSWFDAGAFDDGWQFGDIFKTVGASLEDLTDSIGAGIIGMGEKVVDAGAYIVGGIGDLFGADDFKEDVGDFIAKDLYDERKAAEMILHPGTNVAEAITGKKINDTENDSVFGDKSDSLAQSLGEMLGTAGLQAVGVPWFVTTGVTSFGGAVEGALNEGASYGRAGASAAISAGAEILTEKLFGGSGLGEKGLINLEPLTKGISNKVVKTLADLGVDVVSEGTEEVVSSFFSRFGTALYKEENLAEILASEEAFEEYLDSFIGGGVISGVMNTGKTAKSIRTGRDYRTGLTENEQKVVEKEVEDRIAEREKKGDKLTNKQKNDIYDEVVEDLKKGGISTDTIESVLGGDTYKSYKDTIDSEDAILKEFDELGKKQNTTLAEQSRYAELKDKVNEIKNNSNRSQLKSQLSNEVFNLAKTENGYLSESYNEKARRSKAYEADLSQYDKKYQATVQKAIDSGILNNTRKTHEFVDMIAKISADKGVSFDFTNNEKLKESGFAIDGKTVNGYVTKDGVTLNLQSAKSLNSVVGHEIAHVLEGTELYDTLQKTIAEYAKGKKDYEGRRKAIEDLYKNVKGADIDAELTADLVGDYLFTDSDFINHLFAEHRNVFQKIFDEIKYLCKIATAGSREGRQLEKVKRAFEKAYKESGGVKENTAKESSVKYSIVQLEDGRVYVEASRNVIKGDTKAEQRREITNFFSELLGDNSSLDIHTIEGDVLTITKTETANKARDDFKTVNGQKVRMSDNEFAVKLNVESHIDEVTEVSTKIGKETDNKDHSFAKDGFTYRRAYFKDFDGQYYEVTLSIGHNGSVATVYNVGKIKEGVSPSAKIIAVVGSQPLGKTPYNNSIPQNAEKSTKNRKNSLSSENADIAPIGNYNVSGKDIYYDQSATQEDIAPVREDIVSRSNKAQTQPIKTDKELPKDHMKADKLERAYARIDKQLEEDKSALAKEFEQKKATMEEGLKDKSGYISNRASALYKEISGLKKGVRASKELGYLLDHGFDWNAVKSNLLIVKRWPGEIVNSSSAEESAIREMLSEEYNGKLYELEDIDSEYQDRVAELEQQAETKKKEARNAAQRITRSELHRGIVDAIKTKFTEKGLDFDETLKKAKDLSTFSTVDNTPQRVMEKALGYKEGQILADETVNKVALNETEGIKWLNSFTDRKNGLLAKISKQYNIKPGSKESSAAQMYAEGFYVDGNNNVVEYGDTELAIDFPDINTQENIKGLAKDERIRQIYDETLTAINKARVKNGYPEIQRLDNYFLHFRAMEDTFSRIGLPFNPNDIRAKDLPTDLNGVTADLKPGQPYFASAMHRKGKNTSFDLLGGLERYLSSAKNQIYHIDDIQTLRALRNYIADTYGQAKGLEGLDLLSEEEAQDRIKDVYGAHLSTFAKFLNEEANIIAGKTSLIDRGIEGIIGRRGIAFLDTVNKQVGANMVGFNVSSSLTNFLAGVQAIAKTNKVACLKALAQTTSSKIGSIFGKSDSFVESNPTIIRRKGADRFYRTPYQKAADAGYVLMSAVDNVTTEFIVRAKYNEYIKNGMSEDQAITETDKWTSRLMGDRSLGQMPQLYNSKMLGLVTKFQLEVRNQLDSQFYDTIKEAKASNEDIENQFERNAKTAAKVTATFVELAILQHLFGKAFEAVAGYNPAFDIISVLATALGFDDDDESEDTVLDNVEQGFFELLEDMPYTSTFTGGRIPISSALPISEFIKGEDEYGNEKSRLETLGEIAPYYVLPGGYGQLKKTAQGLSMFDDDLPVSGSYTDSGNLRFPVKDTLANRAQAAVFGQWANENAREYFDDERPALNQKQMDSFIASGVPIRDYWQNKDEYDFAYEYPQKYAVAKAVGGYESYKTYTSKLNKIEADKDSNGKTISGSRKKKVVEYINALNADYGEKIILFKSVYASDDTYNYDIVEYLNSRNDISYEETVAILKELGFTVKSDGTVTW